MKKEYFENLNAEQIKAVTHKTGPLLIVAGAGTGKTTVITRRIAHLISQKIAKPDEILALTFTDKAANEMESRVDMLVPYGYIDIMIATFHAFGDRILRDHALDLGLRPDYRVLTFADQMVFFREHLHLFPLKHFRSLGDPTKHIEAILTALSRARDEDVSPEQYLKWGQGAKKRPGRLPKEELTKQLEMAKIYQLYQRLKAEKGFVDFGDQVNLTLQLFREQPEILRTFQKKYKYVLVDEFQDTNIAQFELLKLLAAKHKNITVVGDDDQSIYKFRGAAISNILNFEKTYKQVKKVVLNRNYRSTQLILDAAYRLIRHNDPDRLEVKSHINKRLVGQTAAAPRLPHYQQFDNFASEADWVAKTIKENLEQKKFALKEQAILLRSNADAKPFCQSLNLLGIPYVFSGGGGLYELPEVKLMISFLRVIGDLADSVSLYDLALSPVYRLDPLDMQKINTFARRRNLTLHDVFSHSREFGLQNSDYRALLDIKPESGATLQKIMSDIEYYLAFAKNHSAGETLYQFLKRSKYLEMLAAANSPANDLKIKNIARFFEKVREFHEVAQRDRVADFIKYLNLLKEAGDDPAAAQPDSDIDAVNLLTVHKAKGLEWPVVFMAALVAEKFPVRARREALPLPDDLIKEAPPGGDQHLPEERRLFYVGMTRAKQELFFSSAIDYGGKRARKTSPFVLEALDLPKSALPVSQRSSLDQIELFAPHSLAPVPLGQINPDELLPLSFYPIDDYLTCPLKYKYVHVLNVPLLPSHTIMYGSALHKAVQAYFSAKHNRQKFTEKDLLAVFFNNWSSEGFISRQHEEARLAAGRLALKSFFRRQQKAKLQVKYVEEEFKFVRDNIQLKGRWDLVLQSASNKQIFIVDFKSTEVKEQAMADRKARASLQLAIYAMSWEKMFGRLPTAVQLYFLDNGLIGQAEMTVAELTKVWSKIRQVAAGIRANDFHPTPSAMKCGYCPYNDICPSSVV